MNNKALKKQTGAISKLLLILLAGGMAYTTYLANKNGMISSDSVASVTTRMSEIFSSDDNYGGHTGYGLQLMATQQLDQAKSVMNDFAKDGYSAFVVAGQSKGRTIYKVRLGPYSHKPEAVAIKDKVIRRYPNNPYVKTSLVIFKPY